MAVLFAGPFCGEFGWELFGFQARVRQLAKRFDKVIVASRPSRRPLYKDFVDEFIPYAIGTTATSEHFARGFQYNYIHKKYVKFPGDKFIPPNRRLVQYKPGAPLHASFKNQVFIPYGTPGNLKRYDVVIHARTRIGWSTQSRNWNPENWVNLIEQLTDKGLSVAAIGSPKEATTFPGVVDFRGEPLTHVMNLLASAGTAIGPSSGPLHLASLCKCPQVVWSPHKNEVRYKKDWNPFGTAVTFITVANWQADVPDVLKAITQRLEKTHGTR